MKDNNVILEVKDLHKSFGEQEVLVSFTITAVFTL